MTESASMQVTTDEILAEIHIAAAPERVFQALVDPAQVVNWWGQGIFTAAPSSPAIFAPAEAGTVWACARTEVSSR